MSRLLAVGRLAFQSVNVVGKPCIFPNFKTLKHEIVTPNIRFISRDERSRRYNKTLWSETPLYYCLATGVLILGMSYAAVPVYRMFCQSTGYGGTTKTHTGGSLKNVKKHPERLLTIKFAADTNSAMSWNFKPQQTELKVIPGETALAFYTAENPTEEPVVGVSTYNVIPFEAGQYFNKIQCFCFEEQLLNPHEEVDMPVFFYIDPGYVDDPDLEKTDTIVLSYTFFRAKDAIKLPIPAFFQKRIA